MCRDHVALADFYAAAFGFERVPEVESPIFVALAAGGVALGFHADEAFDLLELGDRRGGITGNHVTFDLGTPEAVDASVERFTALGATVLKGPVHHLLRRPAGRVPRPRGQRLPGLRHPGAAGVLAGGQRRVSTGAAARPRCLGSVRGHADRTPERDRPLLRGVGRGPEPALLQRLDVDARPDPDDGATSTPTASTSRPTTSAASGRPRSRPGRTRWPTTRPTASPSSTTSAGTPAGSSAPASAAWSPRRWPSPCPTASSGSP